MTEREHPLSKWFGERKIVRLMLLAAILALAVIHIEFIIDTAVMLWRVASPLILGGIIAYILEIMIKRIEKIFLPNSKNKWVCKARRPVCILAATVLVLFAELVLSKIEYRYARTMSDANLYIEYVHPDTIKHLVRILREKKVALNDMEVNRIAEGEDKYRYSAILTLRVSSQNMEKEIESAFSAIDDVLTVEEL